MRRVWFGLPALALVAFFCWPPVSVLLPHYLAAYRYPLQTFRDELRVALAVLALGVLAVALTLYLRQRRSAITAAMPANIIPFRPRAERKGQRAA